jgi:hypothetical protein
MAACPMPRGFSLHKALHKALPWLRTLLVVAPLLHLASVRAESPLPCFADANLAGMPRAMVYVWSPRMVLSATEAGQALSGAAALGLAFVPVVDGRLPLAEWQSAMTRLAGLSPDSARALAETRPLCATELISNDAYRHFPTAFLVVNDKVHPATLVGAMPAAFWQEGLRLRLADLPSAPRASTVRAVP